MDKLFVNVDWGEVIFQIVLVLISSGIVGKILDLRFNKKIESSRREHEKEMNKLKAKLESDTYISNKQYEKEFEIYQDLWKKQIDSIDIYNEFVNKFIGWITNIDAIDVDEITKEIKLVENTLNNFETYSIKHAPFYEGEIFEKLHEISMIGVEMKCCGENLLQYHFSNRLEKNIHGFNDDIRNKKSKMDFAEKNASDSIRTYLKNMKVK